ncbi:Hypothetical predicted protein [Pelobates cultripes]|uniref:Uncharacterized protein n=1 Tax=Pelobates cultripes TaxID=61616 RepID=A0AAD1RS32_PELCU|nr:Hypothetical predicted protein [Pelobates cultripes]
MEASLLYVLRKLYGETRRRRSDARLLCIDAKGKEHQGNSKDTMPMLSTARRPEISTPSVEDKWQPAAKLIEPGLRQP